MAAYNKFEDFVEQLGKGIHQLHATGHTTKCYLSNDTPSASLDAIKTDLNEIASGNGYTSGGVDTQNDYTETGGTGTMTGTDIVITASGGSVGPFRYVVHYNDSQTSPADPLINWWDYGASGLTLNAGESFTIDFGASILTLA
jgi:hypothetical protein